METEGGQQQRAGRWGIADFGCGDRGYRKACWCCKSRCDLSFEDLGYL